MTVKILFIVAFALVAEAAQSSETTYIPFSSPTDYDLDSSLQYILPSESPMYVQLKESLNRLSKTLTNLQYDSQGLEDYSNFYQSNPLKYQKPYWTKLKNFNELVLKFFNDYTLFKTASTNYKDQLPQTPHLYQYPSNGYDAITSPII